MYKRQVRDVAAHVIGTIVWITQGRLADLADPAHTQVQADERAGRSPGELADELTAALPAAQGLMDAFPEEAWSQPVGDGFEGSLADGIEALWYDAYVHADDIRAALGALTEAGPGLRCAVQHVAAFLPAAGFGPATVKLDGFDPIDVGGAGGPEVSGDPHQFVLAATGRQSAFGGVPSIYAE